MPELCNRKKETKQSFFRLSFLIPQSNTDMKKLILIFMAVAMIFPNYYNSLNAQNMEKITFTF